jgi:hypothetical protein
MNAAGLLVAGIGALMLGIGLFLFFHTRAFLSRAVAVTGTVVDFRVTRDAEGPAYQPIISFETTEGETRRFMDSVGTGEPGFEVGESAPVAYDPANPERTKLVNRFHLWFLPGLLSSLGAVVLAMGVALALALPP